MICLSVGLFGTLCVCCTWISVFFKSIFNPFLALISYWNIYYAEVGTLYIISLILYVAFFFFHLSFCCSDWVLSIILSSRSLMHSSLLFSLLFIASRLAFISVIELSNFDWFLERQFLVVTLI